ncbi:MAG: MOSC domain-containing protein [Ilumatobacter sp.]|nr:MOSC domain-containing protein [Ilumatobacter sp.]
MVVTEVWRYPVKSMGGERVESVEVSELGLFGDRRWGVFDVATGNVLTARRAPDLLFATARVQDGDVVVDLPDGTTATPADADAVLSAWLGRDVELRAAGDVGGTYENPMDADNDADWVSWTGPGGAWHDSKWSRVSLASTSSLGTWDVRRFRTNVIVEGAGEDDFVGDHVRIGDVELAVFKRIDRCVMITRPQPGLDRDLDLLKTINREREACLSVGALVAAPGTLAVGDEVERLPRV